MGAMKNPQVSDKNSRWFRFYVLLNFKGHNPFLPSCIPVFHFERFLEAITSFL